MVFRYGSRGEGNGASVIGEGRLVLGVESGWRSGKSKYLRMQMKISSGKRRGSGWVDEIFASCIGQ